eukprot:6173240-Pleurochrysis_carterae.AAC.2
MHRYKGTLGQKGVAKRGSMGRPKVGMGTKASWAAERGKYQPTWWLSNELIELADGLQEGGYREMMKRQAKLRSNKRKSLDHEQKQRSEERAV